MILEFFNEHLGCAGVPVWVARVHIGLVVQATKLGYGGSKILDDKYGHVVGFARNAQNELMLVVLWDDGQTKPVHPSNVQALFP